MRTLSIDFLRECFDLDTATGDLWWRDRPLSHFANARARELWAINCLGKKAGRVTSHGYVETSFRYRGRAVAMRVHRIVFALTHGRWQTHDVDHINGVRHDNRPTNLRDVSRSVNQQNQRKPKPGNKTGFLGVRLQPGKRTRYRAEIGINGMHVHLGTFDTPEQAHAAYLAAKRQHHEGNTL